MFEDDFFDFLTARIEAESRDRCEQSAAASAGAVTSTFAEVCRSAQGVGKESTGTSLQSTFATSSTI